MKQIDEIIYDAICADENLMEAIGNRVVSTCFEVSPEEADNTPLPNIIIIDDGFQANMTTKDDIWEADEDRCQATVDIAAESPVEVKQLVKAVRRAINNHVILLSQQDETIPALQSLTSDGIWWDWMRPCYNQKLYYTVDADVDLSDENENENEQEG